MDSQLKWWQKAVFYQIYPRSFADGNGDGIGDLYGMIGKLDYLQELGVDAIWLSPHYPSPNIDCGYDISDYKNIAPEYGDMEIFTEFLRGLHKRGMYLVLDLVLNHTSDKHPWFIESRSSRNNPKRDWYVWKDGKGKNPPTNWNSTFGGSAWEYDQETNQYYYHFFFKGQPDLNWKNPDVKQAMFNTARFWLDLGVDGFRLDAIGTLFEDGQYLDHNVPLTLEELLKKEFFARDEKEKDRLAKVSEEMFIYQHDLPEVHQVMRELRQVINEYEDRVLLGETDDIAFYGNGTDELHLNFNFPLMRVTKMTAPHIKTNQKERLRKLPQDAWPCNTLGNHDTTRLFTHFADGIHDEAIARLNLMLMLTLKGTPFLYNGEEIGMTDLSINDPKRFRDSLAIAYYTTAKQVFGLSEKEAAILGSQISRDKCRTPMQWSASENAGFSPKNIETWLPVNENYRKGINVADQKSNPESLWNFYQKMLKFRKETSALISGDFTWVENKCEDILSFIRSDRDRKVLVILNYSEKNNPCDCLDYSKMLFQTNEAQSILDSSQIEILPFSGIIIGK